MFEKRLCDGLILKNPLILGPMAGVTDHPFRLLCHEMGAAMVGTEMVSANALKYGNKKTLEFIDIGEDEHPVSLQLFGPDPEAFAAALDRIEGYAYDILDINMGCPMPKIVKNGEGSALMQNPSMAEAIVRECVRRSSRPVTVKLRAGFSEGERTAVELAKRLEAAGASAVAIHGRTREQYYTGKADWSIIREVKEAVKIPVIGNGDVTSGEKAKAMMEETGCDFVMIARGARGNPWIFREALAALESGFCEYGHAFESGLSRSERTFDGGLSRSERTFDGGLSGSERTFDGGLSGTGHAYESGLSRSGQELDCGQKAGFAGRKEKADAAGSIVPQRPTLKEIHDTMLRHLRMQLVEKGEHLGICQMRKHIAWYTTGLPDSSSLRAEINRANTYEEMKLLLDNWLSACLEEGKKHR